MKRLLFQRSFRDFFMAVGILAIAFLLIVSLMIFLSGKSIVERYIQDVGSASLQYYRLSLDNNLDAIGDYCKDHIDENHVVSAMLHTEEPLAHQNLRDQVGQTLAYLTQTFPDVYFAMVVPIEAPEAAIVRSGCRSMTESNLLHAAILTEIQDQTVSYNTWQWRSYNEKNYLSAIFQMSDSYCAVLLGDRILSGIAEAESNFRLICMDSHGYISADPHTQSLLDHQVLGANRMNLDGKAFFLVGIPSQQGSFSICALLSASSSELSQNLLRVGALLLAVIVALCMALTLLLRRITTFFGNLSQACVSVSQGNLDARITHPGYLMEEVQIYDAFNEMTKQIQNLRISLYEQQLQVQSSRMQSLRVQIKSHFFINCLNSIHSLAIIGDNELIQEFTLCLSDYFRYLGSGFSETVYFGSELSHLNNYIKIHQIRYPDRIIYLHAADPELEDFQILPMILQTFVENIFKHAMDMSTKITISLKARPELRDGNRGMLLEIRDTGPGFTTEQLQLLNSPGSGLSGTGIRNTKARLQLYYGEAATVTFENAVDHGAIVRLFFPTFPKQENAQ